MNTFVIVLRPIFFISWFTGIFFQIKGQRIKKKKSSENDQLTGHFQSFLFYNSRKKQLN